MNALDRIIYEAAVKEAVLQSTAVIVADMLSGEVLYVSPPVEAMFGYGDDELAGQSVDILLPEETRTKHAEYRQLFAQSPRARPMGSGMVLRGRHKDGSAFPIQVGLSPTVVIARKVVVAIVLDLTEPVKTASMIQQALEDSGEHKFGTTPPTH